MSRSVIRIVSRRSYGTVQPATGVPVSPWTSPRMPAALKEATAAQTPRTSWTRDEIQQIYEAPLSQLTHSAVGLPLVTPLPY